MQNLKKTNTLKSLEEMSIFELFKELADLGSNPHFVEGLNTESIVTLEALLEATKDDDVLIENVGKLNATLSLALDGTFILLSKRGQRQRSITWTEEASNLIRQNRDRFREAASTPNLDTSFFSALQSILSPTKDKGFIPPEQVVAIWKPKYPAEVMCPLENVSLKGQEIADLALTYIYLNGLIEIKLCELFTPKRAQRFSPDRKLQYAELVPEEGTSSKETIGPLLVIEEWKSSEKDNKNYGKLTSLKNDKQKCKQAERRQKLESEIESIFAEFLKIKSKLKSDAFTINVSNDLIIVDPIAFVVPQEGGPSAQYKEELSDFIQDGNINELYNHIWYSYLPMIKKDKIGAYEESGLDVSKIISKDQLEELPDSGGRLLKRFSCHRIGGCNENTSLREEEGKWF